MTAPLENIVAEQEDIPEDVLIIILSKLPLKSLVRFQSVSRSWYNTITDPHFVALFDPDTFLIIGYQPDVDYTAFTATVPMIAAKVTTSMKTQALPVTIEDYATVRITYIYRPADLIGACSGVICVASYSGEALFWNPATGEEKLVMNPYPVIILADGASWRYIGFASVKDEKNNIVDFKMLGEQINPYQFLVYSLCSNSWRSIKPPDFLKDEIMFFGFRSDGVYLHGVLHWLVPTCDKYFYILTFGVATESFGKIMLPAREPDYIPELLTLVDDKYLAVVKYKINKGIYLWVMYRYGDLKSWAKHDNMWPWKKSDSRRPVRYLYHTRGIEGLLMQEHESNEIYLYLNSKIHKLDPELSWKLDIVRYRESSASLKRIAEFGVLMAAPPAKKAAEPECITEDVLMTILSQLPPKSLTRFKSVSKSWYNTITHPHMTTLFNCMRDPNTFLIIGAYPDVDTDAESTATGPMVAAKITFDMKTQTGLQVSYDKIYALLRLRFKYKEAMVVGACCGVICVASYFTREQVVLWNPATGEEKWVNSYPGISSDKFLSRYMGLASVKDEKNNVVDFKLLELQKNLVNNSRKFLVYSLSSNSWRLIKHPKFLNNNYIKTGQSGGGIYLNGVLHWLSSSHKNRRMGCDYILTFEAATETFGKIMLPFAEESGCTPKLLTLIDDKSLAVVEYKRDVSNRRSTTLYVWVMCNYGDMKSWTKRDYMWTLTSHTESPVGYLDHFGGLLIQESWFLTIALHINGDFVNLDPEISGKLELVPYRESFISMKKNFS